MAKVKVPIFGSPGKVALLDESATNGAIFGVNLFNEDGTVVQKEQIISDRFAQLSTLVASKTESALASVENVKTAMVTADQALASDITTVQAALSVKVRVFRQSATPTADSPGDLWINTGNDNRLFIWSGSAWVESSDGRFGKRNRVFSQATAPTNDGTLVVNDLWIDTDDNKLSRWNGAAWVDASDLRTSANATAISGLTSSVTSINGTLTAQAQFNQTIQTQSDGNTSTITQQQTSIDGLSARAFLKLDVNGKVVGYEINNDGITNNFSILADNFSVVSSSGLTILSSAAVNDGTSPVTGGKIGNIAILNINKGTAGLIAGSIAKINMGVQATPALTIQTQEFQASSTSSFFQKGVIMFFFSTGDSGTRMIYRTSPDHDDGDTILPFWHGHNFNPSSKANTVSPVFTGTVTVAALTSTGAVEMQGIVSRGNANSQATLTVQPRIFVQSTDPGAAAADGDLWFW